jgi:hypothetical protein
LLHADPALRQELGISGQKWQKLWSELDANRDGRIEEQELVQYILSRATILEGEGGGESWPGRTATLIHFQSQAPTIQISWKRWLQSGTARWTR